MKGLDSPSFCGDYLSDYFDGPLSLFMFSVESFDSENDLNSVVGGETVVDNWENSWRRVYDFGDIWSIKRYG